MDFKLLFLSELLFGCLTAIVARSRGRSPWVWFCVGMMLKWIGLLILLVLPANKPSVSPADEVPLVPQISIKKSFFDTASELFYLNEEKVVCGPVSSEAFKALWNSSKINKETWVWSEKIVEWKKLHGIEDLLFWLQN